MQRSDLQADCSSCFALCCVALRFPRSESFAMDKPAGTPCPNLADDLRCTIHAELDERGFHGCVVYDCKGAGQKVSQVTFGGRDWRSNPKTARWMLVVYPLVRQLHEILVPLVDELDDETDPVRRQLLQQAVDETEALTYLPPEELVLLDVPSHGAAMLAMLGETAAPPPGATRRTR
ncbi:MAG: hypothetical protein QOH89_1961 [Pseudonocardiales bacterium]|nr:hypothetical protein [Pseudonocardiales bacterium]